MNIKHMEYFIALVGENSFTKAAAKLGITQPTLTSAIRTMEDEIGAELYEKSKKRFLPTKEGVIFLDACKRITNVYKNCITDIDNSKNGLNGQISIGLPPSRASSLLPLCLPEFHADFPGIKINIKELLSFEIESGVLSGELDMGLIAIIGNGRDGLIYTPVFQERAVIAIKKNLAAKSGFNLKTGDITKLIPEVPFLLLGEEQFIASQFTSYCRNNGISVRCTSRFRNIDTAVAIADSGEGATVVLSSSVSYYKKLYPDILFIPINDSAVERTIAVITREGHVANGAEEKLTQLLRQAGGEDKNR